MSTVSEEDHKENQDMGHKTTSYVRRVVLITSDLMGVYS